MIQKWKSIVTGFMLTAAMTSQSFHSTAIAHCVGSANLGTASAAANATKATAATTNVKEDSKVNATKNNVEEKVSDAESATEQTNVASESATNAAPKETSQAIAARWANRVKELPGNALNRARTVWNGQAVSENESATTESTQEEKPNSSVLKLENAKSWFTKKTVGGATAVAGLGALAYYYKDQLQELAQGKPEEAVSTWKDKVSLKNAGIAALVSAFGFGVYKYITQIQTLEELLEVYVFNTTETDAQIVEKNVMDAAEYYGFTSDEDQAVIKTALQEAGFVNTL
ncbi:MAG: hypothetical protein CL947_03970 [Epsilonproteobacteria bacterium]|nr:hypothetical protein [Campylobacterota bacterium]